MTWEIERRPNGFLWVRTFLGVAFFLVGAIEISKHGFANLEWVTYMCFGGYWLSFMEKRPGESWVGFLRKPRALAMAVLLLASVGGFSYDLLVRNAVK
jgi:hypothetical protein